MSIHTPTILFIEDDRRIRDEVVEVLEMEGYRVFACATAAEARKAMAQPKDLVLLDLGLPDGDGVALCEEFRAQDPKLPLMIVSARDRVEQRVVGLDAGADDYLVKPFQLVELLARIRSMLRRSKGEETPKLLEFPELRIDVEARKVFVGGKEVKLKRRAYDLLHFLAAHPDRLWSREELLAQVWGRDYSGSIRTVDVHIRRLRTILESNVDAPARIVTHYGLGYLFQVHP